LLLDLVMPQASIDGFEVLRAMARDPELAGIPVIILSAKDPDREPLVSRSMMLSRQEGLSPRDLADALQAIVQALKPRFGAGAS
jgi:twitching motility two-component system response regulator PilH